MVLLISVLYSIKVTPRVIQGLFPATVELHVYKRPPKKRRICGRLTYGRWLLTKIDPQRCLFLEYIWTHLHLAFWRRFIACNFFKPLSKKAVEVAWWEVVIYEKVLTVVISLRIFWCFASFGYVVVWTHAQN